MATYVRAPSLNQAIAHSTRGNPAQGRKGLLVAVGTGRGDALESFGRIFIFSSWNPPSSHHAQLSRPWWPLVQG